MKNKTKAKQKVATRRGVSRNTKKPSTQPVAIIPGEIILGEGDIVAFNGRRTVELIVANTGDRPIQVGSHCHFFEANRALRFDREQAYGFRLQVPAGTAVGARRFGHTGMSANAVNGVARKSLFCVIPFVVTDPTWVSMF